MTEKSWQIFIRNVLLISVGRQAAVCQKRTLRPSAYVAQIGMPQHVTLVAKKAYSSNEASRSLQVVDCRQVFMEIHGPLGSRASSRYIVKMPAL